MREYDPAPSWYYGLIACLISASLMASIGAAALFLGRDRASEATPSRRTASRQPQPPAAPPQRAPAPVSATKSIAKPALPATVPPAVVQVPKPAEPKPARRLAHGIKVQDLNLEELQIGSIVRLEMNQMNIRDRPDIRVERILGPAEMIVYPRAPDGYHGWSLWVSGLSTRGLVDGAVVETERIFECVGTKHYGSATLFHLEAFAD